jgi:hypothetical protein
MLYIFPGSDSCEAKRTRRINDQYKCFLALGHENNTINFYLLRIRYELRYSEVNLRRTFYFRKRS